MIRSIDYKEFRDTRDYLSSLSDDTLVKGIEFKTIFNKRSLQGLAGLFTHKSSDGTEKKIMFKIPKNIDFGIRHEDLVMKRLNEMKEFSPHFAGSYGLRRLPVNLEYSSTLSNPFTLEKGDKSLFQDVLFLEYVKDSITLTSQLDNLDPKRVYSIIRQVLLAIESGQRYCKLTHYDLHTDNILLTDCEKNSVFLYRFEDRSIVVPTYGVYPIIIDFGFAFIDEMKDRPIYGPMTSTDAGYLTAVFDPINDIKVFLTGISKDLKEESTKYKYFRRWVRGLFSSLKIDWINGWDSNDEYGATEYISTTIMDYERPRDMSTGSRIFRRYCLECVDVIQTLTNFPFTDNGEGNILKYYKSFIQEFIKIENEIKTDQFRCYALTRLVDIVRESRKHAGEDRLKYVRVHFPEEMMKVIAFYIPPKNVNYPLLIESMDKMGSTISTIYARVMKGKKIEKQSQYSKLPIKKVRDVYNFIEANFTYPFKFDKYTVVYVWDLPNKTSSVYRGLQHDDINILNNSKVVYLGSILDKIITS